ncbi:hypothetical protein IKR55_04885 [bacterium]|nr:hypothetical protein [bacterium]
MNFFEIINECLLELNYKQVNAFSELIKNDHKRIITILNIINKEICACEGWDFLLRKATATLSAGSNEIQNTVNGRILYLFVGGVRHDYCEDVESFVSGNPKVDTYSSFADKLLFPKYDEDKTLDVVYYTNNCAKDGEGNEKAKLEDPDDVPLIPMPYAEPLLIYGTCLRLKANTEHFKFPYWQGMYNEALRNMKSKTSAAFRHAPQINLFRRQKP